MILNSSNNSLNLECDGGFELEPDNKEAELIYSHEILNNSFEDWTAGIPDDWTWAPITGGTITQMTDTPKFGTSYARITGTGTAGGNTLTSSDLIGKNLIPGGYYKMSCWIRKNLTAGSGFSLFNLNGLNFDVTSGISSNWALIERTFKIGTDDTSFSAKIGSYNLTGTMDYDGIFIDRLYLKTNTDSPDISNLDRFGTVSGTTYTVDTTGTTSNAQVNITTIENIGWNTDRWTVDSWTVGNSGKLIYLFDMKSTSALNQISGILTFRLTYYALGILTVDFSNDGITWTNPSTYNSVNNYSITVDAGYYPNKNLYVRFSSGASGQNFQVKNVKYVGTLSGTAESHTGYSRFYTKSYDNTNARIFQTDKGNIIKSSNSELIIKEA